MKATTISSLASEIGVSYWAVRHALRQGYVAVERPRKGRKLYLQPDEVDAIKRHFGVLLMPTECVTDPKKHKPPIAVEGLCKAIRRNTTW